MRRDLSDEERLNRVEELRRRIISWYERHGRKHLPWRGTRDPWATLIAAFFLRKTRTSHVEKVYRRFVERFPTPRALHAAAEEEVRRMITPLGLENRRARQLKQLAKVLVEKHGGRVPSELDDLLCLPGVGRYTAAEVLLACFDVPEPLLDVNMKRLISRIFGLQGVSEEELWEFAKRLVPQDPVEARKFNYGVLDFAQAVCKARKPRCGECPLNDMCSWATSGRPQTK